MYGKGKSDCPLKAPIPEQGMEFYGKAMKTMYGKGKSDAVAKVPSPSF